jgi:hypothetical protein
MDRGFHDIHFPYGLEGALTDKQGGDGKKGAQSSPDIAASQELLRPCAQT